MQQLLFFPSLFLSLIGPRPPEYVQSSLLVLLVINKLLALCFANKGPLLLWTRVLLPSICPCTDTKAHSGLLGIAHQPCRGRRCCLTRHLCKKGSDSFHSDFWIDMISPASLLWCLLLVHPSVSPPTSAAVASLNFIYTLMGTFGFVHSLDLKETHNEFRLPLSMLSTLWAELPLRIRLLPKVFFYLYKDQLQIGLPEGAKHFLFRHRSLNNHVNERTVHFGYLWIFFLTLS